MAYTQFQTLPHSLKNRPRARRDGQPRFKPGWWLFPAMFLAVLIWIGIFKLLFALF